MQNNFNFESFINFMYEISKENECFYKKNNFIFNNYIKNQVDHIKNLNPIIFEKFVYLIKLLDNFTVQINDQI